MEHWDTLLPSASNPYFRTMISVGRLVPAYAVRAFLRPDGDIDVLDISIDWDFPLADPEDDF